MKNKEHNQVTRRDFIRKTAAGAAAITVTGIAASCSTRSTGKAGMPKRILGKTGLEVSLLTFGGGSQFLKNRDGEWEKSLHQALKAGINLFDTAPSYTLSTFKINNPNAPGSGEERYGMILPEYREKIYISTKIEGRDSDKARKDLDESLKKLRTDYVDILLLHTIEPSDDVGLIEKGIYKTMQQMKDSGMVRHIGFSSMNSAERSRDLLKALDWDVALLAMNPTKYGNFAEVALPAAVEKNVGVIAMKVMRNLVGKKATAKELFEYVWTQKGVASAMVGHYGMDPLKENIALANEFGKSQTVLNKTELELRLAEYAGPHALEWARPGYVDGGLMV